MREFQELGYEAWAREKGYGRRWAVETAFSTFKRMFGEHSLARASGITPHSSAATWVCPSFQLTIVWPYEYSLDT